ncbi:hypothetical protein DPMN_070822 [Dreissena polymorpha]|uniref:Uncharacterized protein n=1 Tax=Dreissena polymorpha TaxID=45954 RepID=A0A9D4BVY4_DREPO|nr:hypothetical protein DPMN_070822 [Dreissena polymorpha]
MEQSGMTLYAHGFSSIFQERHLYIFQAQKVEDLGKKDYEEEIKNRFKIVYVPNWFSVDLKTGVGFF